MERSFAFTAGSMNNIGGNNDSIHFRDQRIQEARFWLPCSWSLKSCLRFRFFEVMAWVFWTKVFNKETWNQLFVFTVGSAAGLCLPLLWDGWPVMAPMHRLFCQNLRRAIFSCSNLLTWKYWSVLSSGGRDDDLTFTKCLSWWSDLCNGHRSLDLCHCCLFLDQSGSLSMWPSFWQLVEASSWRLCIRSSEVFEAFMIISIYSRTSPCGWYKSCTLWSDETVKFKKAWFITCLWRLSVSLSWVAQLRWCFPCMLLSWFDSTDVIGINSLLGIWLLCLCHDHSHVAHDVYDDLVMLSISMASVERINEVPTAKTTIDSPEMDQRSRWLIHQLWGCDLAYTICFTQASTCSQGINLSIRSGSYWYLGGTGSGKCLVQLIPVSMMLSLVGWTVAGHDVKEYDLDSSVLKWPWSSDQCPVLWYD